ncbi:serine/threonine-protein kinase meng-po-like [Anopheles aquasalis]|uniref:serine/threonine-protein kinase meng-po-like n=1 Tax=Anopheles aquasalis TaxID=42839 RepID=UPI00215A9E5C|nr:serine/threonine-protein kinase meng-po-like [Anopheles aquasalis]
MRNIPATGPTMKLSESKSDTSIIATLYKSINNSYRRLSNTSNVLHRIPDMEIPCMAIADEYDIEKMIAEGCFAKIFLAHHRPTGTTVVLKAIHTELTSLKEFIREFHYNYQLSHHPNILSCYQVKFQTKEYYVYAQEHAPFGDLAANVGASGLPESSCKKIAEQLSSALGFMHLKSLVHRDLKLENVLVFTPDFSRIKLCDFGTTTREGVLVSRNNKTWTAFLSPEVLEIVKNERFICKASSDSWQFGIVLFVCLTGATPWKSADWVRDAKYAAFMKYQKRETTKIPENFRRFTPRLLRAFRRIFDHREEDRAKVTDIMKYMKNRWMDGKIAVSKSASNIASVGQHQGQGPHHQQQQQHTSSDQDSVKYINHRESRNSFDGRLRARRMTSAGALTPDSVPGSVSFGGSGTTDQQEAIRSKVWDWLETNDLSCSGSVDDLTFWSDTKTLQLKKQQIQQQQQQQQHQQLRRQSVGGLQIHHHHHQQLQQQQQQQQHQQDLITFTESHSHGTMSTSIVRESRTITSTSSSNAKMFK